MLLLLLMYGISSSGKPGEAAPLIPKWLENTKDTVLDTKQWHALTAQVFENIQVLVIVVQVFWALMY